MGILLKYQKGGGIKYGTSDYKKAYKKGTVTKYNPKTDVYQAPDLSEFTVKSKSTTEELDQIGHSVMNFLGDITPFNSMTRIIDDPVGTAKGTAKTAADLTMYANPGSAMYAQMSYVNPITKSPYWEGVDQALDVIAVAPEIGAAAHTLKLGKYVKPVSKSGLGLLRKSPSPKVYKGTVIYPKLNKTTLDPKLEPYLSKKKPIYSKEEEIFNSFLSPEGKAKIDTKRTIHYNQDGSVKNVYDALNTNTNNIKSVDDILKLSNDKIKLLTSKDREFWEIVKKSPKDKQQHIINKQLYKKKDLLNTPTVIPSKKNLEVVQKAFKEQENWLKSDEWLKRRMSVAKESKADAKRARAIALHKLNKTEVTYKDMTGVDTRQLGFSSTIDENPHVWLGIDKNVNNKELSNIANHEFIHASNTYNIDYSMKGIPFKTIRQQSDNPQVIRTIEYLNKKPEQQVRGVRALSYLKEKGLWSGGDISDAAIDQLKSSSRIGGDLPNDITNLVVNLDKKDLKQFLNAVYTTTPLVGVSGAVSIQSKRNGGVLLKYQQGGVMLDNIYNKYPAFKNMGEVTIKSDPEFTRDKTGVGSIEYFSPKEGREKVTYYSGYSYDHPKPGTHGIVYDPKTNNEQSIMLDMMHGMTSDKVYKKHRKEFEDAFLEKHKGDFERDWEMSKEDYGEGDGKEQFKENWIDGQIRGLMFEGTEEEFEKARYWPKAREVYLKDTKIKEKFTQLQDYLKTGNAYTLPEFKTNSVKKSNLLPYK